MTLERRGEEAVVLVILFSSYSMIWGAVAVIVG
jgi:hypothetical protein